MANKLLRLQISLLTGTAMLLWRSNTVDDDEIEIPTAWGQNYFKGWFLKG